MAIDRFLAGYTTKNNNKQTRHQVRLKLEHNNYAAIKDFWLTQNVLSLLCVDGIAFCFLAKLEKFFGFGF